MAFCAGRDVACPGCGYNLRDAAEGACPECGHALLLRTADDPRARRTLLRLIFAWSAMIGGGPLVVYGAYWSVYGGGIPVYGLMGAAAVLADVAALIYGVVGMITLLITRRPPVALSRWWTRAGWVVLLGLSVQYVEPAFTAGRKLFSFSLGLPF